MCHAQLNTESTTSCKEIQTIYCRTTLHSILPWQFHFFKILIVYTESEVMMLHSDEDQHATRESHLPCQCETRFLSLVSMPVLTPHYRSSPGGPPHPATLHIHPCTVPSDEN